MVSDQRVHRKLGDPCFTLGPTGRGMVGVEKWLPFEVESLDQLGGVYFSVYLSIYLSGYCTID